MPGACQPRSPTESPIAAPAEPGCSTDLRLRASFTTRFTVSEVVYRSKKRCAGQWEQMPAWDLAEDSLSLVSHWLVPMPITQLPACHLCPALRAPRASGRAQPGPPAASQHAFCRFHGFNFRLNLGFNRLGLRALRLCLLASYGRTQRRGARSYYGGRFALFRP